MPRMNIRCCCNPGKLLGSVEVPTGAERQRYVAFPINDFGNVRLEVGLCHHAGRKEFALKSMDLGMDVLRSIPSFKEAK